MTCEKCESSGSITNPLFISLAVVVGGIGGGYLLFPASKDDDLPYNLYLRNGLILGGIVGGGILLANYVLKEKHY